MNTYTCHFPKIRLSVSGPPNVGSFKAIRHAFKFHGGTQAHDNAISIDVKINCFQYSNDSQLPEWLWEMICQTDFSVQPRMFFNGPYTAAAAKEEETAFCAVLDNRTDQIDFFTIADTQPHSGIFNPLITILLREILGRNGYVLFHSAAVCYPNGRGALIIGESGDGKTTTALSLVRKGAKLLGDDLTVIEIDGNSLTAHGVPEHLNVTEQTQAFFEEMVKAPARLLSSANELKKTVDPGLIYGKDCWAANCPIDIIYFTKISKKGPFVRPMGFSETLEKLIISHGFCRDHGTNGDGMARLMSIVSMTKPLELHTGPDPSALGSWLLDKQEDHSGKK